jgi:DNA mismatch repair protein MutS
MLFTTDKQTLEDLNIFGRHGSNAIYSLFNRTLTVKGAEILEEMFRYPLSDADAINKRSAIITHLAAEGTVFPFKAELFDRAEQYLADTDERSRLSAEKQSLEKKLSNLVAADTQQKVIYNGITALIEITHLLNTLLAGTGTDSPYKTDSDTIAVTDLLNTEPFDTLLNHPSKGKLPYAQLVVLDTLLRFQHQAAIRRLLRYIYQLDVYIAVATVAKERGFVLPVALPATTLVTRVENFYHPQLKSAVPNSLNITPDGNVIFLTGANMAGKSTFMKSLGIAMYLAHMGFPVAAAKMEFAVMDGIYTTINLPDNLGIGASHFYAEVLRIKKIAKELSLNKNIFVIFDELFRGTNVKDAYEATIAITSAFAKKRGSLFVISTHIIEAGDVLKAQCSNISFKYLPTHMDGNTPIYTYTLETGITADRHGMIIINNEGILDILNKGIHQTALS